uniref:Secreted RxLR effector peptide protein n=1 Tax=Haemonchus contortus TaxID=6289 RepID=A0A7I4YYB6_HAECO
MASFHVIKAVFMTIVLLGLQTSVEAAIARVTQTEQVPRPTRACPLSPYATFLTREQQETLHELVVEARGQGANEQMVKSYIDKYISKVLPPRRYMEFQQAFQLFQANRRGKRSPQEKKLPRKVFDLIDQYSGNNDVNYAEFYKENVRNLKRF